MDIECTRNLGGRCSPSVGRIWWRLRVWKKDQLFYLRSQETGGGNSTNFIISSSLISPKIVYRCELSNWYPQKKKKRSAWLNPYDKKYAGKGTTVDYVEVKPPMPSPMGFSNNVWNAQRTTTRSMHVSLLVVRVSHMLPWQKSL